MKPKPRAKRLTSTERKLQIAMAAAKLFARLGVRCFMSLDLEEYQAQLDRALAWLTTVPDPRELTQPEILLPVIRLLPEVMEYD